MYNVRVHTCSQCPPVSQARSEKLLILIFHNYYWYILIITVTVNLFPFPFPLLLLFPEPEPQHNTTQHNLTQHTKKTITQTWTTHHDTIYIPVYIHMYMSSPTPSNQPDTHGQDPAPAPTRPQPQNRYSTCCTPAMGVEQVKTQSNFRTGQPDPTPFAGIIFRLLNAFIPRNRKIY